MIIDLKELCQNVITLAKTTGAWIRNERLQFTSDKIEVKGLNDLVSYVDKESEARLVKGLATLLPSAGFIVEENTRSGQAEYNWIVDPLDGTTNFIHGVPCYAISIALVKNEEVVCGIVYEVSRDECFYATKGGGSFCNEQPVRVSSTQTLTDSLMATGFPIYNFSKQDAFLQTLDYFMRHTHGIRRMGAAAVDLCYVACGRMDAFYEFNLNAWDVAAGALIVEEAGGTVTDFSGKKNWLFGKEIIAGNQRVQPLTLTVIADRFNTH